MIHSLLAHIGGRSDLPLPSWQLAWAAGFSVAISFVALGAFWDRPQMRAAARGRVLFSLAGRSARALEIALKLIGLFLFGVLLSAAWWGDSSGASNISGDAFLIWFWIGLQFASALFGDVWRAFNPYLTIAHGAAWLRAKLTGSELSDPDHGHGDLWPAVIAVFSYLWYELAYHSTAAPRSIAVFLTLYSVMMLGGAAYFGRGWLRGADGFAVLFTKLSALAPFHVDEDRRLRVRPPLTGVAEIGTAPGIVPFVLVVLGSTTFDGFTRSAFWSELAGDRVGWSSTIVSTFGLVAMILLIGLVFLLAMNVMASITGESAAEVSAVFGPTLVPIVAAYAVAHYFSALLLEGQRIFIHISDPFGRGWDLFGTKDYAINWLLVSPQFVAWVQTLAIAVGHVLAVAAAHDRAIERYPHDVAVRSQYPMLGVMIAYTVGGLFLLLGS